MTKTMGVRRTAGAVMIGLSAFALAACGGGKPSEGDLKDKLAELYAAAGLTDEQAEQVADCAAPKMLDQVSEDGLEAVMDASGDDIMSGGGDGVSADDSSKLSSIGAECAKDLVSGS